MKGKPGTKRSRTFFRIVVVLTACFVATLLILRMELGKRSEQAVLDSLPTMAQQGTIGVEGVLEELAQRLQITAETIQGQDLTQDMTARQLLQKLEQSPPFLEVGLRLPNDDVQLSSGEIIAGARWPETVVCPSQKTPFRIGAAARHEVRGEKVWLMSVFVDIPGTGMEIFGTVDLEEVGEHTFFRSLTGSGQHLMVFETKTGTLLMDTLHGDRPSVGKNFYEQDLLSWEDGAPLREPSEKPVSITWRDKTGTYLCAQNTSVPGWSLCVITHEDSLGPTIGRGIPTTVAYALLALLYIVAAAALLLYQDIRERRVKNQLDQAVARKNSLMNAALPGSDIEVFELLPGGMIRLLSPEMGQGQQLKMSLVTVRQLLDYLNCARQWEPAVRFALDQAAQGQDSEVELQTAHEEETWLYLRIEPLANNEEILAIGTVRDVTEAVREARRRKTAEQFINRMMEGTQAGLEIALEEDHWRLLWGWETYSKVLNDAMQIRSYTDYLNQGLLPIIHPKDREEYVKVMDRKALLSTFLSGISLQNLEYRVRLDPDAPEGEYEWHTSEIYLYRDTVQKTIKCNVYIRQAAQDKQKELEERSRLEEKEHALFLQARKLVESEDELNFVHVIADYYQGIYAVNMLTDQTRSIKVPKYFADLLFKEKNRLSATLERYARETVMPEHQEAFLALVDYDHLRPILNEKGQAELTYQKSSGTWICMRIFAMPGYSPVTPETLWVFEDDTDTMELRKDEEKARVTAEAAEAASQAKSQFLANMSHDIRTPLNAILGMSELGMREENDLKKDTCFRDIRASGRILLENINSILDLSKIEAGKMELVQEEYHILSTLHDVITVLRMRAQEKKLDFIAEVDENIPTTLLGDDVNISHILMNLGSNAVKYTETGSATLSVTWESHGEDGELVIHMKDTGVGIRKEDLPYIFRSYGRLDRRANRHIEGTGLGLTICEKLTELMDGTLGVESTPGVGSDFWVRLPQKVIDPAPCGPYQGEVRKKNQEYDHTFIAPEGVVLVVDDQPLNLKVCQGLLRPYEVEVYTARSGPEALRQMTQVWPDLVFMDHMMPDMDGIETTQHIREMGQKDPYFAVVPIVALTANAMKGARETFLSHGFNDFLPKPVELDKLDEILKTWLPEDKQQAPVRPAEPSQHSAMTIPPELLDLPGLDASRGLSYCGTIEVYRKTLTLFQEQTQGRLERIEASWKSGSQEEYIIEVHSLKSGARWIGAAALGDQAEALEMACRRGDTAQMDRDTPALLAAYQALGEALEALPPPPEPEA